MLGLNPTQVVGRTIEEVFDPLGVGALRDLIEGCLAGTTPCVASDVECGPPGVLILDVQARLGASNIQPGVELSLHQTSQTQAAVDRIVGSLFQPTCAHMPSMIYVNHPDGEGVRAMHNNLTPLLNLPNTFTPAMLHALYHRDDHDQDEAYNIQRAALADPDYLTWTLRARDAVGVWRILNARLRVFSRTPDGAPERFVGVLTDLTTFDGVYTALTKATADLERTETRERERLGRELHDSVSQPLVAAQLLLTSLRRADGAGNEALFDDVSRAINEGLEQIRTLSFLLHPPDLQSVGLVRALQRLCEGLSRRSSMPIHFSFGPGIERQEDIIELTMFRIGQEALMNVHRHARATCADVELTVCDGWMRLKVTDDGVGLPGSTGNRSIPISDGVGIAGMQARMRNVAGELTLSNLEPGLQVLARAPLATRGA